MKNFSIAVHGGAGEDSEFIQVHQLGYKTGFEDAGGGCKILRLGGKAHQQVALAIA